MAFLAIFVTIRERKIFLATPPPPARGSPKRIKGERARRAKSFIFQFERKEILISATVFAIWFATMSLNCLRWLFAGGSFWYWIVEQRPWSR